MALALAACGEAEEANVVADHADPLAGLRLQAGGKGTHGRAALEQLQRRDLAVEHPAIRPAGRVFDIGEQHRDPGLAGCREHVVQGDMMVPHFPFVGGHEGAGIVRKVGEGVSWLAPGDHVVFGSELTALRAHPAFEGAVDRGALARLSEQFAKKTGEIETEIHASGGLPNRVKELQHQVPMQRGGSAEEVAEAIVWLLGEGASYTTMSLIDVSGGR